MMGVIHHQVEIFATIFEYLGCAVAKFLLFSTSKQKNPFLFDLYQCKLQVKQRQIIQER